jgi:hypothetical protein
MEQNLLQTIYGDLLLIATLLSIFELLRGSVGHRTLLVHGSNNFSRGSVVPG